MFKPIPRAQVGQPSRNWYLPSFGDGTGKTSNGEEIAPLSRSWLTEKLTCLKACHFPTTFPGYVTSSVTFIKTNGLDWIGQAEYSFHVQLKFWDSTLRYLNLSNWTKSKTLTRSKTKARPIAVSSETKQDTNQHVSRPRHQVLDYKVDANMDPWQDNFAFFFLLQNVKGIKSSLTKSLSLLFIWLGQIAFFDNCLYICPSQCNLLQTTCRVLLWVTTLNR